MKLLAVLSVSLTIGAFMPPAKELPRFLEHTIATDLKGGYQVVAADLNRDGRPDLIALASDMPELVWFENPGWQRHVIAGNLSRMINLVVLESAGQPIIVLASGFSNEAKNSPGIVSLLEPAGDARQPWKAREIDRLPTTHRLRLADIDGSGNKIVINAPLTASDASGPDYRGHPPLVYYKPGEWKRILIGAENEGVMHGIYVVDWDGDGRDEILTASFVGIHLYKHLLDGRWMRTEIAKGNTAPWPKCGASDIAVGHLGNHRFLCSIEPWHGNQIAVYQEANGSWSRQIVDDSFIDGHALYTADLNGDGRDEIIAGYRGKGGSVYIYSADDALGLNWTRHDLDKGGISVASCAVADLNGDGRPDIACIGSATANLKWYENR
ncbi:MAG TPA: FG-GAP-like repeat-containing protein [Acidobacteriota bacterium]|nr:FG-GAP-like repeat-containing protein [Acidobacteriota bacterium]